MLSKQSLADLYREAKVNCPELVDLSTEELSFLAEEFQPTRFDAGFEHFEGKQLI